MAEVYASPAKRRRMCADAVHEADPHEGMADASCSKAGFMKSKGIGAKMPRKAHQKAGGNAEPKTPSSKLQKNSSTEGALLSLSPQLLAPNLMVLNQLLGALYVTLPMVKSRGKATTYHNMRGPVQNFCGRDFQVHHVQQIKALYPEALGWEHVLAVNPTTKRQEQQLCIHMPTDPANPKQSVDTTRMQQLFYQRLQQHQASAGPNTSELELPLAELPPAAGPSARDCTPSRQRASILLPATPQTAPPAGSSTTHQMMSPPPKRLATAVRAPAGGGGALMSPPPARTNKGNRRLVMASNTTTAAGEGSFTFSPAPRQPDLLLSPRGGAAPFSSRNLSTPVRPDNQDDQGGSQTPNLRPNRLFDTPVAAATPQQSSAARPNTHATPEAGPDAAGGRVAAAAAGVKVRKLTFEQAAPSAAAAAASAQMAQKSGGGVAPAGARPGSNKEVHKTRGGIKFELGESTMALLKQVSSAEVKQEAAVKHEQLEQQRALDMLPGSFEVLRAVFGERGPCVKPKAEVLQLLRQKSTSTSGMSAADATQQLDLMLRLVPELLRLVTASGACLAGITQSVRINRQVSWPAARKKLLAGAAEACSSGYAAAAQAVAAEQQRVAEEAAAVGAEAVELDGDDVSGSESEEEALMGEVEAATGGAVDELGLDILAELGSNTGMGSSSNCANSRSSAGLSDEVLMMLGGGNARNGGGSSAANKKGGVVSGAVLGALAFKAPAKKASAK